MEVFISLLSPYQALQWTLPRAVLLLLTQQIKIYRVETKGPFSTYDTAAESFEEPLDRERTIVHDKLELIFWESTRVSRRQRTSTEHTVTKGGKKS